MLTHPTTLCNEFPKSLLTDRAQAKPCPHNQVHRKAQQHTKASHPAHMALKEDHTAFANLPASLFPLVPPQVLTAYQYQIQVPSLHLHPKAQATRLPRFHSYISLLLRKRWERIPMLAWKDWRRSSLPSRWWSWWSRRSGCRF